MNAALYIRVSTDDQIEYSPDSQRKLLLDYAKKNDMLVKDEHIFVDEGISGRNAEKRPAFQNMIAMARSKEKPFQKILVWKFSRFARNQEESIVYKNMLRKDGIEVISISEPIVDGPFGSLIERIIEWMDEYYSTRLSSEVMRGMSEKAEKEGVPSSAPFGYRLKDKKYVIDEEEAKVITYIFENVAKGTALTRICLDLLDMGVRGKGGGRWHPKRIKYVVCNPAYKGALRWNYSTHKNGRSLNDESDWIIKENTHEPIVSEELFEKANSMITAPQNSSKRPKSYDIKHWLCGLLRCSSCGGTLIYNIKQTKNKGPRRSFRCNGYNKGTCKTSNYVRLEEMADEVQKQLIHDYDLITNHKGKLKIERKNVQDNELKLLHAKLERIQSKLTRAKDAYMAGIDSIDEYKANKSSIINEEKNIKAKIEALNNNNDIDISPKILNAINILDDDTVYYEDKNTVLKSFIDRIVVDKEAGTIDIYYYV